MVKEQSSGLKTKIVIIACFMSVFSQLPFFVQAGRTQLVCFPMWIISFVVLLLASRGQIKRSVLSLMLPSAIFLMGVLMDSLFGGFEYLHSSLLYSFIISIFIFFIGATSGNYFNNDSFNKLLLSYVFATVIVSIVIYLNFFRTGFDITSRIYAYSSKNSISQIIFTAIIILMLRIHPERKLVFAIKWGVTILEIILLLLLKSRATIIGLILCIMIMAFSRKINRKLRNVIVVVGVVIVILLLTNERFNTLIFDNILLAGRSITDLDNLSSGRISIIKRFPELLDNHWIFGSGARYFECFPLSAVLQFGLVPGFVLVIISLVPLYYGIRRAKLSENWLLLVFIAIGYNLNSVFEGIAPFGPGIKCFLLWLLFGILITSNMDNETKDER